MAARRSHPTLRQLLDAKSAELRQAGQEISPGPLARCLTEAKGFTPHVALQLASDYLLAEPESRPAAAAQRLLSRRARAWLSGLALGAIGAFIWFFGSSLGWEPPRWFVALILGLAGLNLLVWTLEPVARMEKLDCARCGAPRCPDAGKRCPACGARELKLPRVSRMALWAVALFFAGWSAFIVYGAMRDPPNRTEILARLLGWLILSAAVVLRACGFRVDRVFGFLDLKIDKDFDRMARHPHMAIQVLLLIVSLVAMSLAILALLRP